MSGGSDAWKWNVEAGTGSVQVKDLKEELALWCPGTHALGPRVTAPLAMHASGSCLSGIVICSFTVLVVRNLSLWSITTNRLFIKQNVAVPVARGRGTALGGRRVSRDDDTSEHTSAKGILILTFKRVFIIRGRIP